MLAAPWPPTPGFWIAVLLAALALVRAALGLAPSMAGWGVNLLRFSPGVAGWLLWAASLFALHPRVARAARGPLARAGEARRAGLAWALGAAALALALPERLLFAGDFLLRAIASHTRASGLAALYPQGLPLDALLHDRLPRALAAAAGLDVSWAWRALGALEAALLALLGVRLARTLEARGAAAFAVPAVLLFGGGLALFAGYNKAFAELALAAAAVGVLGIEAARRGTGLLALAAVTAGALLAHRLAVALVPAWIAACFLAARAPRPASPRTLAAAAVLPAAALAAIAPRLLAAGAAVDAANFTAPGTDGAAGFLAAALDPRRLLEAANALLFLAPLAPLAALAPALLPRRPAGLDPARREAAVLAALVVPLLAFVPFFHPPQGWIRDWDALAPTAAALSVAAAWCVARALADPRAAALALAVALGAAAPAIQSLMIHHDLGAGLARVRALAVEPPARPAHERATAWDFLGARYLDVGLADSAAAAFARAAALAPSPRVLREWAAAEIARDRPEAAREIYRRLLARKPDEVPALLEYALLSARLGDSTEARRAAGEALRHAPGHPRVRAVLEAVTAR